jgi:Lar family restriction alleviation protein
MSDLKPCPFCGTPYPYITFEHGYIDDSAVVFCDHCKISVKLEENDQEGYNATTKRKAIEAWNRRANENSDMGHSDM